MKNIRKTIGGLGNLMFKQAYLVGKMLDGEIPDVYLQSEGYWKDHANTIKIMYSEGIKYIDKVSIHIRRGDYVNNDFYIDLWKTNYYRKAIAMFPNEKFIVFCRDNQSWDTDKIDRQWCREHLTPILGDRFELPPKENTEIDDFNLMAGCKSNIMANSSFSWWASYLNPNPDKKIVCPNKWFSDGLQRTELLDTWIKI